MVHEQAGFDVRVRHLDRQFSRNTGLSTWAFGAWDFYPPFIQTDRHYHMHYLSAIWLRNVGVPD